jgi:pyrroloquinoline-quinone synthase
MEIREFFNRLEKYILLYDLLRHPFYQAWSRGALTREDLQTYARNYFHHVEAFPRCLAEFARRLHRSQLQQAVLVNLSDELGYNGGIPHTDLWRDFAEGIGAGRALTQTHIAPEVKDLATFFKAIALTGRPEQVVAAFYVYESQTPAVSKEKVRGLRKYYRANDETCRYFTVHASLDTVHSQLWRAELDRLLALDSAGCEGALKAAEAAAISLWEALDGIERACLERLAN